MSAAVPSKLNPAFEKVKNLFAKQHYVCFDDLINMMRNKPQQFRDKVLKATFWGKGSGTMKFDAVVGNPPYQLETGSTSRQALPIYNYFVEQALALHPSYASMITPSRWFAGGMALDQYRENMMNNHGISKIVCYLYVVLFNF